MKTRREKQWLLRDIDQSKVTSIATALDISTITAKLLVGRGVDNKESARNFISPSINQLHDPYLMLGMDDAVARILRAIKKNEPILVYGDYDVDGTTGTVVLRRALSLLGARTGYFIPHRFTDGYGVHQSALEKAYKEGYRLIISVDCGIRAYEPLLWARQNRLDVIITDHHLPDSNNSLPPAFCILNPNRPECKYPDKHLAGVGVAFKLAHALLRTYGREHMIRGFLKMVAIGTVADVAPLVGENRTIVAIGLSDLPNATNPGLRALMEVAGCGKSSLSAYDLGFRLGPRINAAGRMDAARLVVELFEATDKSIASNLANTLDMLNRKRQDVQREITEQAISEASICDQSHIAVIAGDGWHRGVIGIAASKVSEHINRPCIVISLDGEVGHGSARSIEAYHLLNGLTECADLFDRFGGHSHAAGLVISKKKIPELRRRLNAHAATCLSTVDLTPLLHIDDELSFADLSLDLATEIERLEPFGAGCPRPLFVTRNLQLASSPIILKEQHLKLSLTDGSGRTFEALWWGGLKELEQTPTIGERIEIAYYLDINRWNNQTRLQLIIEDMKRCRLSLV
jgi:single-stranded-DNA-specific exonuclease